MKSGSSSLNEDVDVKLLNPKLFAAKVKKKQLNQNLKEVCKFLGETSQDTPDSVKNAIAPLLKVFADLLRRSDVDVFTLSICFIDCLRIFAPNQPFPESNLEEIFECILKCLETQLKHSADSSVRVFTLVEKLASIKALVLLIDIEDSDQNDPLLFRPFNIIFNNIAISHYDNRIAELVADILISIIEELQDISYEIVELMLKKITSKRPAPAQLARHIVARCAQQLQRPVATYLSQFITQGDDEEEDEEVGTGFSELQPLIRQLFLSNPSSPDILLHVMPILQNELTDQHTGSRTAVVNLLCEMFEHADSMLHDESPQLFSSLMRRFCDKEVSIRERMLKLANTFVEAHPLARPQLGELLLKTTDRLMDRSDAVRAAACDALTRIACDTDHIVTREQLEHVSKRILDKKPKVRVRALAGLARVYHTLVVAGDTASDEEFQLKSWIPSAIMKCYLSDEPSVRVAIESAINDEVIGDDTVERTHRLIKLLFNVSDEPRAFEALKRMLTSKHHFQQHFAAALRLGSLKRRDDDDELSYSNALKQLAVQLPGAHAKNEELLRKCCATGSKQEYKKAWQIICNHSSSRQKVSEAKKHLYSRLRKSMKPEFVNSLLLKLCMSIVFPDNVPELLLSLDEYITAEDEASIVPLVSLLQMLATLFPSFFSDAQVFKSLHDLIKSRPSDPAPLLVLLKGCETLQQTAPAVAKSLKTTLINIVKDRESPKPLVSIAIECIAAIYPTPVKVKLMGAIVASAAKNIDSHSMNSLSTVLKCYPDAVQKPQKFVKSILQAETPSQEGCIFLARFLMSIGTDHPKFGQMSKPIFSRFVKLLSEGKTAPSLRRAVVQGCVLLDSMIPPSLFNALAYCSFDDDESVRREVLSAAQSSKSLRSVAVLALFDLDPVAEIRKAARTLMERNIRQRRARFEATHRSEVLPEHATPYLVHILAHWTGFDDDVENGCPLLHSYLKSFLNSVLRGSSPNFSFLSTYFEELKLCRDAFSGDDDKTAELITVCDLGSRYVIQESERRNWRQHSQPNDICVPASLFQVGGDSLGKSLLPAAFQTPKRPKKVSPGKRKSTAKKSTTRKKKKKPIQESDEEVQEDEENEESSSMVLESENSSSEGDDDDDNDEEERSRKSKRSSAESPSTTRPKRTRRKK